MKSKSSLFSVLLFSSLASAAWSPQGQYSGTCVGNYAGQTANPCQMTLYIESSSRVTIPAECISQTPFSGVMFDPNEPIELRSGGWAAQPKGQTLSLTLAKSWGRWRATGSGRGISDGKWTYRCTFNQIN